MSLDNTKINQPTMYCRQCRYTLHGLPESRCPECGTSFDPTNPSTFHDRPDIPASHEGMTTSITSLRVQILLAFFFFGWGFLAAGVRPQGFEHHLIRCTTMLLSLSLCLTPVKYRWKLSVFESLICGVLIGCLVFVIPLFIYGTLTVRQFADR